MPRVPLRSVVGSAERSYLAYWNRRDSNEFVQTASCSAGAYMLVPRRRTTTAPRGRLTMTAPRAPDARLAIIVPRRPRTLVAPRTARRRHTIGVTRRPRTIQRPEQLRI